MGRIVLIGGKEVKSELEGIEGVIERNAGKLKALGAAFTAIGAAGLAVVQTQKELKISLNQTGVTLGLTNKQMYDLAGSITDVGLPLKEVAATFDVLTRSGMRDTDQIKAATKAFDALSHATGMSTDAVAGTLIPAFKALGEQIPTNSADLDKFTWLAKNTTIGLEDFGAVMNYVAIYGQNLNVTSEEMIVILAALEDKGIRGAKATRMFRTAINEAATTGKSLNEVLGLSQDELDRTKTKLSGVTGVTERYAKEAEKQYTLLDKIKQKFSELTFKISPLLQVLQPVLAIMTALGPALIFVSSAAGIATVRFIAHTAATIAMTVATAALKVGILAWEAAQWLLNAALDANPIGIIILAIGALIAIVVLLVKNWDKVSAFFVALWDGLKKVFWAVVDWMKEWGILFLGPVGFIIKYWDQLVEFFKGIPAKIGKAFETVKDFILAPFRAAWHGIEVGINWLIGALNKISFKFPSWVPGLGGKSWGIDIPKITLPEFAQGGVIPEPTLLYGLRSQRPYAMAGEAGTEYVTPGGRTINIFVELDGKVIAKAIGQPLVDQIRLRTGIKY